MLRWVPFRHALFPLALLAPLTAATADPLPAETYAALPQIDLPRLSPDGRAVAMISPRNGRPALRIWRNDDTVDWHLSAEIDQISWVAWKGTDRLLFSVRATEQEAGGHVTGTSRLVFLGLNDHKTVRVQFHETVPMAHVLVINREPYRPPNVQDRVISLLPDDPERILIAAAKEDLSHPYPMTVDVREGSPRPVMRAPGTVVKWLADQAGVIRLKTSLGNGNDDGSILTYEVRDGERDGWRVLRHAELDHGPRFVPLAFSPRAPTLFVLADGEEGRLALREMDTRTGQLGTVLAADARCDIEPVMNDQTLVGYLDPCRDQTETYFDAGWQKDQAVLQRALKTPLVAIIDRSGDGQYALIKSAATATAPPSFWYFNQAGGQKLLMHLGDSYEGLPAEAVAPVREVGIPARDGTLLPAFLTLPRDMPVGPIAFVVLPHGGPTARDTAQFDWIVQFLANRGYGVLQPQFRGSTGYGAAFQRAGYQQWGRAMQDDVTDATRWLIAQKLADPRRLCIAGSSYGGYSALMGAAQHPDLYRCAVAIAPVTDVSRLLHDRDHAELGDVNHSRVAGDLAASDIPSPFDYTRNLVVPLLLIHGKRDFTVPAAHSEALAAKLTEADHAPTVLLLDKSDHFFSSGGDRLLMLKTMEQFLAIYLSGDLARQN